MKHFKIKVCGITRPSDAILAARLGADMIGMIFWPGSKRFMTLRKAKEIVAVLPATVSLVGIFVDQKPELMFKLADKLGLDFIQLHGSESARVVAQVQKKGYRVIKAFGVDSKADIRKAAKSRADLVMLDNIVKGRSGGTGMTFDWKLKIPTTMGNLVLSGGITPENVARGIAKFHPLVVDVNSGVEVRPGVKSPTKMKHFFDKCNRLRYGRR